VINSNLIGLYLSNINQLQHTADTISIKFEMVSGLKTNEANPLILNQESHLKSTITM
jgi:hypothetical protein